MLASFLLLALVQTAQAAPAPAAPPAWTIKDATDANGKTSSTASIRSADGSGRLIVRCDTVGEPVVSVQYIPNPKLPASDPLNVTVTYDEQQADISNWTAPGAGIYADDPFDVFAIASKVAAAKTIRIDAFKPDGSYVESSFKGPGNDTLFRQVFAACGRKYEAPPSFVPKDEGDVK